MDLEDARRSALALPEVTERQSWGQPAWFHRNLVARMWDEDRLTVRVEDDGERLALVEQEPALYSTTDHHAGTNLVLIAMDAVDRDTLQALLAEELSLLFAEALEIGDRLPGLRGRFPSRTPKKYVSKARHPMKTPAATKWITLTVVSPHHS